MPNSEGKQGNHWKVVKKQPNQSNKQLNDVAYHKREKLNAKCKLHSENKLKWSRPENPPQIAIKKYEKELVRLSKLKIQRNPLEIMVSCILLSTMHYLKKGEKNLIDMHSKIISLTSWSQ